MLNTVDKMYCLASALYMFAFIYIIISQRKRYRASAAFSLVLMFVGFHDVWEDHDEQSIYNY